MASTFSNYLVNTMLQQYLVTNPVYLALHTSDPGVLGDLASEVVGGDYARQLCAMTNTSGRATANNDTEYFDNLPVCTITHVALWTASAAGSLLVARDLATPVSVPNSARYIVAAGDFAVSL